ncbi:MAG: hypothetical protein ACI4XM_01920 [Candidatus Coprovivens sp.]
MQGDYETGQIIDLGVKRKKTKKQALTASYISVLSGIVALDGLIMYSNPEATVTASAITLAGVVSAALFARRANLKKEEYQNIQRNIENYRSSLRNKGIEYGPNQEDELKYEDSLPIFQVMEEKEENPEIQLRHRRR